MSSSIVISYTGIAFELLGFLYAMFFVPESTEFAFQRRRMTKAFHKARKGASSIFIMG